MFRKTLFWVLLILILVLGALILAASFLGDLFWFQSLQYDNVFWTSFIAQWALRIGTILFLWLFFSLNCLATLPVVEANWRIESSSNVIPLRKYVWERFVTTRRLKFFFLLAGLILAVFLAPVIDEQWLTVLQFLHSVPFGIEDPLFNLDLSFYIFKLPVYRLVYGLILTALVGSAALSLAIYSLMAPWELAKLHKGLTRPWKHLGFIVAFLLGLKALGYLLGVYELVYSPGGVTFGAGFTDVHANLPSLRILVVLAVIAALSVLASLLSNRWKIGLAGVLVLVAGSGLLGLGFPALVQRFQVEPNEMVVEEPYLRYNIDYTQKAYGLDSIEVKDFPAEKELGWEDLKDFQATLNNIRLWDWRPLQQTYNQLQSLRLYYRFKNVDIDRYEIDGEYRQVMLAARELEQAQLSDQAKTWVNNRLRFTHGYGVVASPVNEVTAQGLPKLLLSDIPPIGPKELSLEKPQIYYGEADNPFVVVNTKTAEFDYPTGSDNSYNHYDGTGGVQLDSFLKRLIYAVKFADYRLLFTSELTPDSRLMFNRNIKERVQLIAPFLVYDNDPYLVIDQGRLFWIMDAYTTSSLYPYSEPHQSGFNYIRNPVKVVIDAYHGDVQFYLVEDEPLAQSLNEVFGGIFRPLTSMPENLQKHLRYPEDLFKIQAEIYTQYHMDNPQVFYNREDAWEIPREVFAGEQQKVDPYYNIVQLPGNDKGEYILMLPFKPARQLENMVAWMAGRSDGENYGKLLVYRFPKGRHVYGTSQVEARIDQDSVISQQLTLWDQRGSQVIRGNLLVIPIAGSLLYVEPIFLQAEQSQLPELTRVILHYGERIVMEPNLELALTELFGENLSVGNGENAGPQEEPEEQDIPVEWQSLTREAGRLFSEAEEAQRAGDWATYGSKIQSLEQVLLKLQRAAEGNSGGSGDGS